MYNKNAALEENPCEPNERIITVIFIVSVFWDIKLKECLAFSLTIFLYCEFKYFMYKNNPIQNYLIMTQFFVYCINLNVPKQDATLKITLTKNMLIWQDSQDFPWFSPQHHFIINSPGKVPVFFLKDHRIKWRIIYGNISIFNISCSFILLSFFKLYLCLHSRFVPSKTSFSCQELELPQYFMEKKNFFYV